MVTSPLQLRQLVCNQHSKLIWELIVKMTHSFRSVNLGFSQFLMRISAFAGALFCIGYTGGIAVVVLGISVYVTTVIIALVCKLNSSKTLLFSLLLHIVWAGIASLFLLPMLKHWGIFPSNLFFEHGLQNGFKTGVTSSLSRYSQEVSQTGALFVLAAPGLVTIGIALVKRQVRATELLGIRINGVNGLLAILLPYTILKMYAPWYAIAPFTSGDGRNNLLITMGFRFSEFKPLTFIDVGILPNTLASLISAGNGAVGVTDVADIWAIAFVYILAIGMITFSFSVAIGLHEIATNFRNYLNAALVLGGLLFAINPTLLSFCLNDGFFSLYFATALLIAGSAIILDSSSKNFTMLIIGVVMLALTFSYSLLLPAWLAIAAPFLWNKTRPKLSNTFLMKVSLICLLVLLGVFCNFFGAEIWARYLRSVTLRGSFIPMSPKLLVFLIIGQISVSLLTTGKRSLQWRALAYMGMVTLVQYSVIEIANSTFLLNDNSYYGTKIIVATAVISMILTCLLVTKELLVQKSVIRSSAIGFLLISLLFISGSFIFSTQTRLNSAIPPMLNGWGYPDADELQEAVSHWNGPPFLFLEYSNSLDRAGGTWRAETQQANDRLLNFWSPVFWNVFTESKVDTYHWIYDSWNPGDLGSMCSILKNSIDLIVTRSNTLQDRLQNVCGFTPTIELRR